MAGYTRLALSTPTPAAEVVSRAEWAAVNLDTLSHILDPVAARLDERLAFAGPLAGALRAGASATLAAEAGLVMGYLSSRVLGQYDVSLLGAETDPRLLFVGPNLAGAVRDLDVDADAFGRWICAHELTHVFQFQGVPWLREHMAGLLRRYVETLEVRIEKGAAGGLPSLPDPARLVEAFREGGLAALVQSPEQRALMDEVQAAMSVIEGYSEHVMDASRPSSSRATRSCASRDGPPPRVALGPAADHRAPARLRREAAPVRAGEELGGRRGRAGRHRGPEPRVGVPGGAAERRASCGTQGSGSSAPSRPASPPPIAPALRVALVPSPHVTNPPRRFTYMCSSVYFYRS